MGHIGIGLFQCFKNFVEQAFIFGPLGGLPLGGVDRQVGHCRFAHFAFYCWPYNKRADADRQFAELNRSPFCGNTVVGGGAKADPTTDRLALYQEAKDYITLALASDPDNKLQARLTEYDSQLDELIRQAAVLKLLVEARKAAKKKIFQGALNILDEAKENYQPTGQVLKKVDDTYAEIDLDFSKFVISEWYKAMKGVARDWLKQKENKDVTVTEGANYARRQMDVDIQNKIMEEVGGTDPKDIKERFVNRFKLAEEPKNKLHLSMKKASFGEDGFYQGIVGGHLPIAGQKPNTDDNNGNNKQPGRRGPNPGGKDRDGIDNPDDGFKFQDSKEGDGIKLPEGVSPDDIKDILRRALGKDEEDKGDSKNDAPKLGKQDLSELKVPDYVPSLTEWWEKISTTSKAKWMVAVYVKYGGTMTPFEYDKWDIKYK